MKTVGIITINDNNNYGNRLQNYAVQKSIDKLNLHVLTLKNIPQLNDKKKLILRLIKYIFTIKIRKEKRMKKFKKFNENLIFSKYYITPYSKINKRYDYYVTRK